MSQTIRDRDTWAIYKLYTNWHAPADLRLEVEGGHLYRRGVFGLFTEAGDDRSGQRNGPGWAIRHRQSAADAKENTAEVTLRIGPVEKRATGYQMAVRLPDRQARVAYRFLRLGPQRRHGVRPEGNGFRQ